MVNLSNHILAKYHRAMLAQLNDGSAWNVNYLTVGLLKLNKSGRTVSNIRTK